MAKSVKKTSPVKKETVSKKAAPKKASTKKITVEKKSSVPVVESDYVIGIDPVPELSTTSTTTESTFPPVVVEDTPVETGNSEMSKLIMFALGIVIIVSAVIIYC